MNILRNLHKSCFASILVASTLGACTHSADDPRTLAVTFEPESYHAVLSYRDYGSWFVGADKVVMSITDLSTPLAMVRISKRDWQVALTKEQTDVLTERHKQGGSCTGYLSRFDSAATQAPSRQLPIEFRLGGSEINGRTSGSRANSSEGRHKS